jgi:hypothetical protein
MLLRTTSQEMEQVEGWVDFHKAARTLGVATQTMHFLLSRGYIEFRKVPNPFASTEQTLVSKASLASFQDANVAVGDLARELSSTVRKITRMLEENGIQPIFEKTCYVIPFYKRGDVRSLGLFKL